MHKALLLLMSCGFFTCLDGYGCKWSNEGCSSSSECCSTLCIQKHHGTNARCTKSPMGKQCLYDYHCEGRLTCGNKNKCCAGYWETCSSRKDCCDPDHKCLYASGFFYKKCLFSIPTLAPPSASSQLGYFSSLFLPIPVYFLLKW